MSERFRLPIAEQEPTPEEPEPRPETERRVELKIAQAFLKNKFPLSEEGEALRRKVDAAVKAYERGNQKELDLLREQIPTVERPRLENFADFQLNQEQKLVVFGPELACVQVAKGCRHQCEHCAAGAGKKVEYMPFAAVLKIAEELKKNEGKDIVFFEEWKKQAIEFLQQGVVGEEWKRLKEERGAYYKYAEDDFALLARLCEDCWSRSQDAACSQTEQRALQLYEAIRDQFKEDVKLLEDTGLVRPYLGRQERGTNVPGDYMEPFGSVDTKPHLTHYWDSDPFDYRDTTFLHEDGTPADYGDVFLAHMPVTSDIEITTAGWPKNDAVSQRAAEKVVRAIQPFLERKEQIKDEDGIIRGERSERLRTDHVRISVHPFERGISHGDMVRYREDLENVLRTFADIKPGLVFIQSDDKKVQEQFIEEVISPLAERIRDLPDVAQDFDAILKKKGKVEVYQKWIPVSHFSGRAKEETAEKQWDVLSCMEGIHLRPDGSVEKQEASLIHYDSGSNQEQAGWQVAQGTRPKPLGFSLYQKKKTVKGK